MFDLVTTYFLLRVSIEVKEDALIPDGDVTKQSGGGQPLSLPGLIVIDTGRTLISVRVLSNEA